MPLSRQFVSEGLIECVGDIPNIAKRNDSHKLRPRKVSSSEKRCTTEHCCFGEPCSAAVKYILEQRAPEVDLTVEVRLVEYSVSAELDPMEVSDIVKSCPPKTDTFMEDRAMKVGAPLENSLTECGGPMKNGFIEIEVRLKEGTPKIHIFFKDNRPEIYDISKCTPDASDILVKKDLVVLVAFQFDKKNINNAFNDAIREYNGGRIALECLKEHLCFDGFVVFLVHLYLLPCVLAFNSYLW